MTNICQTCGMVCRTPTEYHPYAACLMFKACHDGDIVRANLEAVRSPAPGAPGQEAAAVQALTRLTEWAQAVHPEVSYSGDHPIAVARRALGAGEKTS